MAEHFDVVVIGGGGTGSEVAFQLAGAGAGLRIAITERDKLGGECNHYGCVPTKVMLRSAKIAAAARDAGRFGVRIPQVEVDFPAVLERARQIIRTQSGEGGKPFEDQGIRVIMQEARIVGPRQIELSDGTKIEADRIVLASGTEPTVPPIEGLAGTPYWTNKEAIWTPSQVPRSLAVIGTGAIGIEFAQMYARFGAVVTSLETAPQILPNEDADAAASLRPALEEEGIRILTGVTISRVDHATDGWSLKVEDREPVETEELLVATGRHPSFEAHDLAAAGIELNELGNPILTDTLRTTAEDIWAAGDATGELLFTHVGTYEAGLVVADILGRPIARDYRVIPQVTFCDPEVASVGLTEQQARDAGHDVKTAIQPLKENERAQIDGQTFGLVKLVADGRTGELVGGHIVGEEAGAMIHEIVAAMADRSPLRVLAEAVHAYPTRSESIKAAFAQLAELLKPTTTSHRATPPDVSRSEE